ncbi:MAG TPA: prolyl oligopeptidase family serine peptidase [Steroidobacteraceae bacterium]|nr:prolyl oligopeptidase family serine peptidase [Steroidobacteraceae bacterium]
MPALSRLLALSGLILTACGGGDGGDEAATGFVFPAPTQARLEGVQAMWRARDLAPREATVFHQDDTNANYQLRIYEHIVGGRRHYGVVTIPKGAGAYPVVLFADGLDQSNPSMDLGRWEQAAQARLGQFVYVVPVFRGRTLIYRNLSLSAGGDFCDAYDGAADDSIALLNIVDAEIPQADFTRVMARGGSRGGNIALLLGVRDARVTAVSAGSAPVDFYRAEVANHYAGQYRCQFLDGKSEEQSRERMLASSPLHYPMRAGVRRVYLDHGDADVVVPPWNATEMAAHLRATGTRVELQMYAGFGHSDIGNSSAFQSRQHEIYEWFRQDGATSTPP